MKDKTKPAYLSLASNEYTQNGYIDQQGRFFACDFTEHTKLMEKLRAHGMDPEQWPKETNFVKVTTGIFKDMTLFLTMSKNITGKQKIVIEEIITKFRLKSMGVTISSYGGWRIEFLENGKFRWTKKE